MSFASDSVRFSITVQSGMLQKPPKTGRFRSVQNERCAKLNEKNLPISGIMCYDIIVFTYPVIQAGYSIFYLL